MQPMYTYPEASNHHSTFMSRPYSTPIFNNNLTNTRTEYSSPLPSNVPTPGSKLSRKSPKKKKKRDPNEPNRPVSAYALFFRYVFQIININHAK